MQLHLRDDSVEIEGYVNAVERDSKPLWSRMGRFVERIKAGAFRRSLEKNPNVEIRFNHNPERVLGNTADGSLELTEDNIGLHARAVVTDSDVIEKAKNGELVGWSFGFRDVNVVRKIIDGMLHRDVEELDLREVSILDDTKTPAYDGTLIMAREDDGEMTFRGEPFIDEIEVSKIEETRSQGESHDIDYTPYHQIIEEMKGD